MQTARISLVPRFGSAPQPGRPLASCIMPTANRRAYVSLAVEHFQAQDYAPAELVVVDSGDDAVEDLCRGDARIRYFRAPRGATIGTKRNLACSEGRGVVVVHWDDDDWSGSERLRVQVEPIASGRADVTGMENRYVWNLTDGSFWTISADLHRRMFVGNVHGGTLAYRKSLLGAGLRYLDVNIAEDAMLLTGMLRFGHASNGSAMRGRCIHTPRSERVAVRNGVFSGRRVVPDRATRGHAGGHDSALPSNPCRGFGGPCRARPSLVRCHSSAHARAVPDRLPGAARGSCARRRP